MKNKKKSKKAVSIMVSYVLLIIIAITLSILIYTWLKKQVPKEVEECEIDVSLIMQEYSCDNNQFSVNIKNQGFFSVDGLYIRVSSDGMNKYSVSGGSGDNIVHEGQAPIGGRLTPGREYEIIEINYPKIEDPNNPGTYIFIDKITHIEVEPYLLKQEKVILCESSVVRITTSQESGCRV